MFKAQTLSLVKKPGRYNNRNDTGLYFKPVPTSTKPNLISIISGATKSQNASFSVPGKPYA